MSGTGSISKARIFKFQEDFKMEKNLGLFILLPLVSMLGFFGQYRYTGNNSGERSPRNLYEPADEPKCTDCHSALVEKKVVHAIMNDGCDVCHQVKVSEHPEKVSKGLFLTDFVPGLCYTCHEGVKKDIDTMRVVHQAVKEKKQCMNCHSPHSSDEKKLLIGKRTDICLSCHNKEIVSNGKTTKNIGQLVKNSKVVHPALAGGCTSCHKPHASSENFLLISAYPVGQYARGVKDTFAICWECHDSDLLELAKTTTSTGFRNGEKNLHKLHLSGPRSKSCSMCHDVHASNSKFLILDKIAFGKWSFTMNYVPADSGGTCSPGCHGSATYKR
jgi:predicted CXXCH cytochrome family protein